MNRNIIGSVPWTLDMWALDGANAGCRVCVSGLGLSDVFIIHSRCTMCAEACCEPHTIHAKLYGETVHCCSPACFENLGRIWAPTPALTPIWRSDVSTAAILTLGFGAMWAMCAVAISLFF